MIAIENKKFSICIIVQFVFFLNHFIKKENFEFLPTEFDIFLVFSIKKQQHVYCYKKWQKNKNN